MLRTRQTAGKSAGFVLLVCCGYVCDVISKLVAFQTTGILSPLIWLYAWNLCVTVLDLYLVLTLTRARPARAIPA